MLGYPVVVIPCGHHVQELIPKHVTRLLSGRATTGPGEVLFLKFYNAQNQIRDLIRPDTVLKKFDWNQYEGTSIEELGFLIKRWSQRQLREGSFQRGDYRWFLCKCCVKSCHLHYKIMFRAPPAAV